MKLKTCYHQFYRILNINSLSNLFSMMKPCSANLKYISFFPSYNKNEYIYKTIYFFFKHFVTVFDVVRFHGISIKLNVSTTSFYTRWGRGSMLTIKKMT